MCNFSSLLSLFLIKYKTNWSRNHIYMSKYNIFMLSLQSFHVICVVAESLHSFALISWGIITHYDCGTVKVSGPTCIALSKSLWSRVWQLLSMDSAGLDRELWTSDEHPLTATLVPFKAAANSTKPFCFLMWSKSFISQFEHNFKVIAN